MSVHVTSEIGTLRRVLVHTPGAELLGVTPGTREDFLYDDIIDLENARKEHKRFVAVLERFSDVLHVREALAEVLTKSEVRERLVARTFDVVPSEPLAQRLAKLPVKELVDIMIAGARDTPGPIAAAFSMMLKAQLAMTSGKRSMALSQVPMSSTLRSSTIDGSAWSDRVSVA